MYHELLALEEEIFKVIANQKRLEIIQLLNHKELHVSEMVAMLGVPQANLSQHLSLLRQSNLVRSRRVGQKIYYSLADKNIARSVELIYRFLENQHRLAPKAGKSSLQVYPIAKDPVCGMRISTHEAYEKIDYYGKTYFFCASGCADRFSKNISRYTKQRQKHAARP